jgi:membrane associated rhomboid family serine protease
MSQPSSTSYSQEFPRLTPAVKALIGVNAAVLFLQLTLDSDIASQFAFTAGGFPERWWSVLTYMFVHVGFTSVLANMYALYLFGPRVEHGWGPRRFTWFYLLCGVGGVLCDVLFVRAGGALVGATAAVWGVMTAYALQWPEEEVYIFAVVPMRAWVLAAAFCAFVLVLGVVGSGGDVVTLSHLGGIMLAWIYMRTPISGGMDPVRQRVADLRDPDEPPRAVPRVLPRSRERMDPVDEVVLESRAIAAQRPAAATPAKSAQRYQNRATELDQVLDKISQNGLESLTESERHVLEEMSRQLRGRSSRDEE